MSGAPVGNENSRKGKLWREALQRALELKSLELGKAHRNAVLDDIAMTLVNAGLLGEQWAVKEIGDRLDGKPAQAIVGDDDHDPVRLLARIERHIVRPQNTDR